MNFNKRDLKGSEFPKLLHHLDLAAGYHAIHRIDTFSLRLVEECRLLLPRGGLVPRVDGPCSVRISGPTFGLYYRERLILTGGIGRGRDSTWWKLRAVMKDYDYTLEEKARPGLWLAEVPLPCIYELKRRQTYWIFDFLKHLAAAMIVSEKNRPV